MTTSSTSDNVSFALFIFFGFLAAGVIVACCCDSMLSGMLDGLLIWFIGFIIAIVVAVIVPKDKGSSESTVVINKADTKPISDIALKKSEEIIDMVMEQCSPQEIDITLEEFDLDDKKEITKRAISGVLSKYKNGIEELSLEFVTYIDEIIDYFGVHDFASMDNAIYVQYCQNVTLLKVLNGIMPNNTIDCPINWQKDEHFIMAFTGVVYYEEQVQTIRVGHSSGMSIRVAKGVYYRTGAFQSHPVSESHMQAKGRGALIITNKNVYFYSIDKSLRLPYGKIIAFVPFSDAMGIQLDKENSKTMYFQGLDGTYAYNLVSNIGNVQ
jgi:hypothetical protein